MAKQVGRKTVFLVATTSYHHFTNELCVFTVIRMKALGVRPTQVFFLYNNNLQNKIRCKYQNLLHCEYEHTTSISCYHFTKMGL